MRRSATCALRRRVVALLATALVGATLTIAGFQSLIAIWTAQPLRESFTHATPELVGIAAVALGYCSPSFAVRLGVRPASANAGVDGGRRDRRRGLLACDTAWICCDAHRRVCLCGICATPPARRYSAALDRGHGGTSARSHGPYSVRSFRSRPLVHNSFRGPYGVASLAPASCSDRSCGYSNGHVFKIDSATGG